MVPGTEDCISSAQFSSVAQLCLTLCDPMNCSTTGLPVHHQLLEFTQTHVYRIDDAIQPSHLCHTLLLLPPIPPSIRIFSKSQLFTWGGQNTGVSALASLLTKNTQDWSPLEWTGWTSLQSKGLSRVFSNTTVQTINSSALSFLHSPLSHPHMTTGKTIALTRWTLVGKVMSLLLNMLSRLIITFLPRSKRLSISWLQSPSAVILEPPLNKVWHCFRCFPVYFPWSDGTRCHDLHFLIGEL